MSEMSADLGFHSCEVNLQVALLPSETAQPLDGVKRQLNNMLFRYDEGLEGIPLVYQDLRFSANKEYGRILCEHPWVHVEASAKILVFNPSQGLILQGQISKVPP